MIQPVAIFKWTVVDFMVMCMGVVFLPGASQLCAQEQIRESEWKRGYHGFNMICASVGLQHQNARSWVQTPARKKVLVIFGDPGRVQFQISRYVENGGTALIASDQKNSDIARLHRGIRILPVEAEALHNRDAFQKMPDCPVVTDIRIHPSLDGVEAIVSNRPGSLMARRDSTIAFLPALKESLHSNGFIAAAESETGGRIIAVADQSVFSNQMIIYKDNAKFTRQTLQWLKSEGREHVLVVANGKALPAYDPSDVELEFPGPSRAEVREALKNLPTSALLDFGNAVANVVEDENMVNEILTSSEDNLPQVKMNRALLFLMFGVACFTSVITYFWQKKLTRQTASEIADQLQRTKVRNRKSEEFVERQTAAGVLIDTFCIEFAGRRYNDWPSFPQGTHFDNDPTAAPVLKSMADVSVRFKTKRRSYWTRANLEQLEQEVHIWKLFCRKWMESQGHQTRDGIINVTIA